MRALVLVEYSYAMDYTKIPRVYLVQCYSRKISFMNPTMLLNKVLLV